MAALGTNRLTLLIEGEERAAEVSRVVISVADTESDFVSFADAAAGGGKDYVLELTAVQDPGTEDSIWDMVWEMTGQEVDVIVKPYGNATASATQPHFSGTVVIKMPDGDLLGGEADASATARFVTELEWMFTAKPTKITS